jgi:hypothetical protein
MRSVSLLLGCQFAFYSEGESERFLAKTRNVLAALSLPTTRDQMNGRHTALFKTAGPHPKRFGSRKV